MTLVVFGKAASITARKKIKFLTVRPLILNASALDPILDRFDKIRFNKGDTSTGEVRTSMQKVMQEKCAVFRTDEFNFKRYR